mmetsp:Transcript_33813/g.95702  ORF Transcript_33813/g.95702 Transcript_33813/m.95702 type:complete len:208 (+) Transcript_33813:1296-1919(+)
MGPPVCRPRGKTSQQGEARDVAARQQGRHSEHPPAGEGIPAAACKQAGALPHHADHYRPAPPGAGCPDGAGRGPGRGVRRRQLTLHRPCLSLPGDADVQAGRRVWLCPSDLLWTEVPKLSLLSEEGGDVRQPSHHHSVQGSPVRCRGNDHQGLACDGADLCEARAQGPGPLWIRARRPGQQGRSCEGPVLAAAARCHPRQKHKGRCC